MTVSVFGIRHHGPGSARSLRQALTELQPDVILVEGPPDAAAVLSLLGHPQMQPPVAMLLYVPATPQRAVYYPLAEFSPEWQAIQYGLTHERPIRFMDLPMAYQFALEPVAAPAADGEIPVDAAGGQPAGHDQSVATDPPTLADESDASELTQLLRRDPLRWLAEAAGDSDGEAWWERMVEQRRDSTDLFAAIREAMTALRETMPLDPDEREQQREAFMRQTIRAAEREGFARIAVVCGAWHAPVLIDGPDEPADAALLKNLPKVEVAATWVPWTDERLTFASGYGAGVVSPGWYHHLWHHPHGTTTRWLTRVARLLREQGLDVSSAHVIEAVRMAEALSALRDRAWPGLPELTEATRAIICHGDDTPMALIHRQLIIGERLGGVPDETPMVPLQADLLRQQRRLRLPAEATQRTLDLDLRQATDLERSQLLHRLRLLEVKWGLPQATDGSKRGTFHEYWLLQWRPELAVSLVAAGVWGNTLLSAATACAQQRAAAADLAGLTQLVEVTLLAELPAAIGPVMDALQAAVALSSDVNVLMTALPPLVNVQRYGNVRGTDSALVGRVVDGLVARICIGLPGACASLDDDAAQAMYEQLMRTHTAIGTLDDDEHQMAWRGVLERLAAQRGLHGLLAGRCCRLLLDGGHIDASEAARRLGLALSTASEPAAAGAWIEGFLKDSGTLLLHDEHLLGVLDGWLSALRDEAFIAILPLLRRTFSSFQAAERRQIGERIRSGPTAAVGSTQADEENFDAERAAAVLPLVAQLLGLTPPDLSGRGALER